MMDRAKASEEDYFRRQEAERRRDDAWEDLQRLALAERAERARLKAQHVLTCPNCSAALEPRTMHGVEVQRCASCDGIWLASASLAELTRKEPGRLERFVTALRGGAKRLDT